MHYVSLIFCMINIECLAMNIMATFIHNEPMTFSVLQEKNIPSTFLNLVGLDIPPSPDVILLFKKSNVYIRY